jgi:hypothetical protein
VNHLPRAGTLIAWAILAATVTPGASFGYPFMIRRDYTACAQCHADPSGGGLLTPYGRAAGELLLRSSYGAPEDRDPGKVGNFAFGAVDLPENLQLGGAVRGMLMNAGPVGAGSTLRAFPMQLDLLGQLKLSRVRANLSLGYGQGAPTQPISVIHREGPQLVSRHHWLGVDLGQDNEWLLRFGRMNLPFGLRGIAHNQWVRDETRSDTNVDQQHGLALAFSTAGIRGEVMGILGNLLLKPAEYRELGYSAYLEWAPFPQLAVGASSLIAHADADLATGDPMWRHAHGLFARFTPHPRWVFSTEQDLTLFSQPTAVNRWGLASLLEADFEPVQGVHLIATGELRSRGLVDLAPSLGVWGSLAWFFAPHADLRADLIYRQLPASADSLALLFQLHFFL